MYNGINQCPDQPVDTPDRDNTEDQLHEAKHLLRNKQFILQEAITLLKESAEEMLLAPYDRVGELAKLVIEYKELEIIEKTAKEIQVIKDSIELLEKKMRRS